MSDVAVFQADRAAIAQYLGLNPRDPKSHAVVAVCERYGLDPILKHVVVIPKGGVYITRDGLLHVAHMSGALDGIVVEEEGETETEWWCRVSVYRKDMRFPFKYKGRYSKSGSNKAYGPEMALKCAEALALRRAFDVTGLPVLEERDAAPQERAPAPTASRLVPVPSHDEPEDSLTIDHETGEIVAPPADEPVDAELVEDEPEPLRTDAQSKHLFALLRELGIATRNEGLEMIASILGHEVESTKTLTKGQASKVIDALASMKNRLSEMGLTANELSEMGLTTQELISLTSATDGGSDEQA